MTAKTSRVRINLGRRSKNVPTPEATTASTWPDGVFARYQTLANATVDLTYKPVGTDKTATHTECTGCEDSETHEWANWYHDARGKAVGFQDRDKGDRNARDWAQTHAEKCRALPKPSA